MKLEFANNYLNRDLEIAEIVLSEARKSREYEPRTMVFDIYRLSFHKHHFGYFVNPFIEKWVIIRFHGSIIKINLM